jgi:hypothetical protein
VTPRRNSSLAIGFRFRSANDAPRRDPKTVTLEGSNMNGTDSILGRSWTLIYQGESGLAVDPGRLSYSSKVWFSNNITFTSYRLLITVELDRDNSVHFSEFQLIGT